MQTRCLGISLCLETGCKASRAQQQLLTLMIGQIHELEYALRGYEIFSIRSSGLRLTAQ